MKYHTDTPYKSDIEIDGKVLANVWGEHHAEGRAHTPEQKREVIEQLYQLWICLPGLRFGQMLLNWANGHDEDFYNIEDRQFIESLNAFYNEMDEWHGKEGQQ